MYNTLVVEVFKTNVQDSETALLLLNELHILFPNSRFNFALDDCDKILRAESDHLIPSKVIGLLESKGFLCEVLD